MTMAFWSNDFSAGGEDPKRKYRWKVQFDGLGGGKDNGIAWFAKTVGKPNFTVTESDHTFLNHKFYYPGRVEWQPVTLVLVDPVSPVNVGAQIAALATAAGYELPNAATSTAFKTMSKSKAASSIGTITIQQLNSEAVALETWTLKNPFIKTFKWGDLDYSADDLIEMELEIRYDWAECIFSNGVAEGSDVLSTKVGDNNKVPLPADNKFFAPKT